MLARYRGAGILSVALCGVLWLVCAAPPAPAQELQAQPSVDVNAAAAAKAENGQQPDPSGERPGGKPGSRPDGKPNEGGEAKAEGEKPGGKDDKAEKKSDESPPTRRPTEPAQPADPEELKAQPDDDGLISFSFRGQPWPAVLEWLADLSQMSLEWQEAPAGFLDLTTRRRYTVPEVRDLINSVLLARGYTLLRSGEILLVVKLEDLDVSLVPRVTNDELNERGTYEIVKTFFDLNRLRAETVAEELKPLLSPHGKITPLKTTNRLEVVETAGNLRRLRDLLADEQDASGQEFQVREFPLQHVRADDVLETLNTLLGIDNKKSATPMSPEQMQQQQEQMRRAMEQAQRQGGQAPQQSKDEPEIFLAVNRRNNSIVAHAAPDKLAIIEQSVRYLDVRQSRPSSVSPLAGLARIRNYRLNGAQPAAVIKVLEEMGDLSPSTQLVTDDANQAIIANAPMVDHITIGALVEQLNGSGRSFEVVQLRRLDAEYVAGSIEFLMRGPQENNNSRRSYYWWRGNDNDEEEDKFQVEADTQNNRLLLRANEVELEEIRQLLIKLGEDPYSQPQGSTMRVIRATPGVQTEQLIERLRRLWPTVGPNPLQVEPGESEPQEDVEQPDDAEPEKKDAEDTTPVGPVNSPSTQRDTVAAVVNFTQEPPVAEAPASRLLAANFADAVAQIKQSAAGQQPAAPAGADSGNQPSEVEGAPISITRGPQGLVITSRDSEALAAIMDLVDQIHASQPSFRVFQLRHTYASDIALLLEDIFEDKEEGENNRFSPFFFYYDERPSDDNARSRLSTRRPLKFIPDSVTNTVLVQNADDGQLAEIEQLLEMYDRVEPPDSQSVRKTEMVQVRFGEASGIAAVVKDVFLDLLSPNDEALAKNRQQQEQPRERFSYFGSTTSSDDDKLPRFKGLLSVGVDAEANMLVVSAPQFLLTDVVALIRELDDAARPNMPVVRVMQPGAVSNALINNALTGGSGQAAQSSNNTETRRNGDRARAERWREERRREREQEGGDDR